MRLIEGRSFYKEPWYGSYHAMMDRCYREKAKNYPMYGGRGISVCEEWHDIEAFEKWTEQSGFQSGLTLERKNVNGDYCPENCECHTVSEWANILGINRSTLNNRVHRGWPVEKALGRRNYRVSAY